MQKYRYIAYPINFIFDLKYRKKYFGCKLNFEDDIKITQVSILFKNKNL